jgi:hypothetical protein
MTHEPVEYDEAWDRAAHLLRWARELREAARQVHDAAAAARAYAAETRARAEWARERSWAARQALYGFRVEFGVELTDALEALPARASALCYLSE